jgi:dipeptidyl aminopeptidase/acylaminoacyl peptidase
LQIFLHMKKSLFLILASLFSFFAFCQKKTVLSVEQIMQDPKWIGTSPTNLRWALDNSKIYFNWNPERNLGDSLYKFDIHTKKIEKVLAKEKHHLPSGPVVLSNDKQKKVYAQKGDLYLFFVTSSALKRLTYTLEEESEPSFSLDDQWIVYKKGLNLFAYHISEGITKQLSDIEQGKKNIEKSKTDEEAWLASDQNYIFDVLRSKKEKEKAANLATIKAEVPKKFFLNENRLVKIEASPGLDFILFSTFEPSKNAQNTKVPNYVSNSGYTEELSSRSKVGSPQGNFETYLYAIKSDTILRLSSSGLVGIRDLPDFRLEQKDTVLKKTDRKVVIADWAWSPLGTQLIVVARAQDNKDRWIANVDLQTGRLKTLDRQRDEAWVAGPGIGWSQGGGTLGWLNEREVFFQSEATGYSHLYKMEVATIKKTQLTDGKYEVLKVELSADKAKFFITTNAVHPGEQHFYHLSVNGGSPLQITSKTGAHEVVLSPDEKMLAIRYSYSNIPWELYWQANNPEAIAERITNSVSTEFLSYPWREPEIVVFKASDGQEIFGRLYRPIAGKGEQGKAVVFVHGAGYLQNAHKWWSSYFREYMFHNLLADRGYTVLDIDYRASAGYGRAVRTGIYRHMGGKDLSDHVDAARFLVKNYKVHPQKIGIYGGSYGGFITLMALFTAPDVFKAGAALRPVTDWAAYNHGYTSNILNEPHLDTLAYKRSSPIYFANGLKNSLLICHGVVDVNVHYQDVVRLSQRLIELKKDNWELASYPVEDHGFLEPSSWTDEYKRILKLFEEKLK